MQNNHLPLLNIIESHKVRIISSIRIFLAGMFTFIIIALLVTLYIFLINIVR